MAAECVLVDLVLPECGCMVYHVDCLWAWHVVAIGCWTVMSAIPTSGLASMNVVICCSMGFISDALIFCYRH